MFLHYLGKHEHEPRKLCLFSHAVYHVLKTTLLWLAISLKCINQFFVDNNILLLGTVCKCYFSPSHFVFETRYAARLKKNTISEVHVSPCSAETLVNRDGITNHRLIAYSVSNISVKNN